MERPSVSRLLVSIRSGALLATLAASPILVGFLWNAFWGESQDVTPATFEALLLGWLAAAGVVAGLTYNIGRATGEQAAQWFYPCLNCGQRVAIISYRCLHCRARFSPPPVASAFRNALLLGVGMFYTLFTLGAFVLNRS